MKKQSIISLILGVVSLSICWVVNLTFVALPIAIAGFILSLKAHKTIKLSGCNTLLIKTAILLNAIAGLVSGIIIIEFIIYNLIKLFLSSIG